MVLTVEPLVVAKWDRGVTIMPASHARGNGWEILFTGYRSECKQFIKENKLWEFEYAV